MYSPKPASRARLGILALALLIFLLGLQAGQWLVTGYSNWVAVQVLKKTLPSSRSIDREPINVSWLKPRIAANMLGKTSDLASAIYTLEQAPLESDATLVIWDLVRLHIQVNDYDRARQYLQLLNLSTDVLVQKGDVYYRTNEKKASRIFLEEASAVNNGTWTARRTLGAWWLAESEYKTSVEYLVVCATQAPADPYTLYLLGLAYRNLQQFDLAIESLERANTLLPNSNYTRELAQTHYLRNRGNDLQTAIMLLRQVISLSPQDSAAANLLKRLEQPTR